MWQQSRTISNSAYSGDFYGTDFYCWIESSDHFLADLFLFLRCIEENRYRKGYKTEAIEEFYKEMPFFYDVMPRLILSVRYERKNIKEKKRNDVHRMKALAEKKIRSCGSSLNKIRRIE